MDQVYSAAKDKVNIWNIHYISKEELNTIILDNGGSKIDNEINKCFRRIMRICQKQA